VRRAIVPGAVLAFLGATLAAAAEVPKRVASLNLTAD